MVRFPTRPGSPPGFQAGGLLFAVGAGPTVLAAWFTHLGLVPVPIALAGLAIVIGAWWLPRRTATGRALQRVISFRSYLRDVHFDDHSPRLPK